MTRFTHAAALIAVGLTGAGAAQTSTPPELKWKTATPVNALPNPYQRDANWARLPAGLKWGAVIGAEPGRIETSTSSTAVSRTRARGGPSRPSSSSIHRASC